MSNSSDPTPKQISIVVLVVCVLLALTVGSCSFGKRSYDRYQRRMDAENELQAKKMDGEAALAKAQADRKIAIAEAEAKEEAAESLGRAEVKRARALAEAMDIISSKLKDNPEYLHYLWIQGLQDGSSEVIYIPTEANIPILEVGRK